MQRDYFVKGTERLVSPVTAGSVHFLQQFFGLLPKCAQRKVIEGSSRKTPYMGFIVDPYALFLFYEVANEQKAQEMLPKGFRLAKTRVFEGEEELYYAILSFFRVRASVFWGNRSEFYLVAENEETGLLSWVIVDYLSDTVSYDKAHGLRAPSAPKSIVTTTDEGRVLVDVCDERGKRAVSVSASLEKADMHRLDEQLWVEGNLSVAYGPDLSPDDPALFSLTFRPCEMSHALKVPLEALEFERVEWYESLLAPEPSCAACFPYAQHLLSDSPGVSSNITTAAELEEKADGIDFADIPSFSPAPTRKAVACVAVASVALLVVLARRLVLQ